MLRLLPLPEPSAADQAPAEGAALNRDLLDLADEFERKARDYRARAAQLGAQEDLHKATEDRMERLWSSPEVVQGFLDKGLSLAEAQGAASVEMDLRLDSIEFHWRRHLREGKQAARLKRNREIFRLRSKGWRYRRIAAALDPPLSESMVANVLKHQHDASPAPGSLVPPSRPWGAGANRC